MGILTPPACWPYFSFPCRIAHHPHTTDATTTTNMIIPPNHGLFQSIFFFSFLTWEPSHWVFLSRIVSVLSFLTHLPNLIDSPTHHPHQQQYSYQPRVHTTSHLPSGMERSATDTVDPITDRRHLADHLRSFCAASYEHFLVANDRYAVNLPPLDKDLEQIGIRTTSGLLRPGGRSPETVGQ
jgi:hypothetical protein